MFLTQLTSLAFLTLLITAPLYATEIEQNDIEKTDAEQLADLIKRMNDMQERLMDDRHDEVVQIELKKIDEDIEKLIKRIEGRDFISKFKKLGPLPAADDKFQQILISKNYSNEKFKVNLPSITRNEIVQMWASEIPVNWKKRIEAYFISLAAEGTRTQQ